MAIKNAVEQRGFAEAKKKLTALLGTFDDNSRRVASDVKELALEAGTVVRDAARANAPYDPNRKTGTHLRDAIFVDSGDPEKPDVLVGVNYRLAPHAHLQEHGSSRTVAHPYMRPAIEQTRSRVNQILGDGVARIISSRVK